MSCYLNNDEILKFDTYHSLLLLNHNHELKIEYKWESHKEFTSFSEYLLSVFSPRFDWVILGTMKEQICDQCGFLTSSLKKFNEHYQIHLSLKFNCEECPKEFETKNKLRWHKMNTHQGQVQCDVCCKFFSTMNNLERHKNNVHDKCSVSCEKLNFIFKKSLVTFFINIFSALTCLSFIIG